MIKKQILACLATLIFFAVIATLVQWLIKPLPATHPLFPFVTLEDRTLPFFNRAKFHDSVYAWYALDDRIAESIAIHQEPLGKLTPKEYNALLLKTGDSEKTSPLASIFPYPIASAEEDPYLYTIRTNSYGFRGPEFSVKKPPATLRIVAAGDSLTFGFGLPEEKTWVNRLQNLLQENAPQGIRVEVINAGVIAFDSTLGKELITEKVLPLNPDWVIVGYGYNDYNFANQGFLGSSKGPKNNQETFWDSQISKKKSFGGKLAYYSSQLRIVQLLRSAIRKIFAKSTPSEPPAFAEMKKNLENTRGKHASTPEQYRKNIQMIIEILQSRKIHVLLLNSNVTSPLYLPSLQELSQQAHVPLVNFREVFSKTSETSAVTVATLFRIQLPEEIAGTHPKVYLLPDYFSGVEIGATELNDRGVEGDRVVDDGIFTARLPIQRGTLLSFRFGIEGTTFQEEFDGWRIFRRFQVEGPAESIEGESETLTTPIYLFNDLSDRSYRDYSFKPYMSEICHPNGKGNQLIAETLFQTFKKELDWKENANPLPLIP